MIKRSHFTLLTLMMLVLSIALYGCGGGKTGTDDEKAPADEQSSDTPVNGGSVVVGISQDLDSLDPDKAVAAGTKEVLFNVFEGLVKPDKDGNLVPAVAESYEISPDGKVYTFKLRGNVKFHNGNLVTADDIVYSLKRCAGLLDTTDPAVVVESALTNVSDVKKVDETTVEVDLKEADTELIGYLTSAIIPKDYDKQDTAPIGTGPFKFVSYTPMESFVVEKNEDYYQAGKPYLDKVTFKIIPNADSAIMELLAGSVDIFPYLTDTQAEQLKDTFTIAEGHMNLVQGLYLNNKAEPFNNVKVRQALNYAVDKQAILDLVAGGRGSIIGSNMFPGFAKYYEDLADKYPYDVQKAKDLLAEAGYPDGFSFTITVPSNYKFHVDTAQVIVEQLKQVGITASIQQVEWASWISDVYVGRNYESTIIGLDAKLAARDVLDRYESKAENNFLNYSNPQYDDILGKAIASLDDKEKINYYKTLQTMLNEDAAAVYIQDPALLVAINKKLGGYTFYPVYVQDMASVYYKAEE
ncbi:ABC transporter substrate-binding protein [Anaerocolumna sedimenticola]|uniref:ABC transporter substrate-binding protein n=1 Tax=Anaerocolumna sedimenticola TaxID=2696063 RepID=UPI00192A61C1|nr:ABC transporter substrate-binding protein [Anaerocolumna sedimenticola]